MTKTITLTVATAALVLAAGGAHAQTQDWTGPYVGLYGAATQTNDQSDERLRFDRNLDGRFGDTVVTTAGADAFSPGSCDGAPFNGVAANGCDGDATGAQAGVVAGYDMQFGAFVVGGVLDYSAVDAEDSVTSFSSTPASYTFSRKLDNLAAARVRLGYAMGPALIYGTGGVASGEMTNRFYTSNTANSFTVRDEDDRADGYQAGGGVEYRLAPNLSVTGEYLYTSLDAPEYVVRVGQGTAPATNPFVLAPNTTGTDMNRSNGRFGLHAVRIGMNYRF